MGGHYLGPSAPCISCTGRRGFSSVDTLTAYGILLLRRLGGGCQAVNQHVGTPGLAPLGRASTLPLGTDGAALDLLLTCGGA